MEPLIKFQCVSKPKHQNTYETKVLTGEAASAMALSKNALLGIVHKAPIYRLSFSFRKLRILLAQALITWWCGSAVAAAAIICMQQMLVKFRSFGLS